MMTAVYLLLSLLTGCGFYLATAHQKFLPKARGHARWMRGFAWACGALALAAAIRLMGVWAGVFSALTAIMLALVCLPYLDAWLQQQKNRHVG